LDGARAQGVSVLFAIESGSRAWGFPSPDSDYDCRFVYAQSAANHFVLEQARDVIEFPIEGDIDAGGWDLRKALLLALAGNAVIIEWVNSPLVYEEVSGFRPRLRALFDAIVEPSKVSQHYLGLARSTIARMGGLSAEVRLKKLFYLIRPIVALDWMAERNFAELPPMSLPECMTGTNLPSEVVAEIRDLIERKAVTHEMGVGPIPPPIARYVELRYGYHEMNPAQSKRDREDSARRRHMADSFYRTIVESL